MPSRPPRRGRLVSAAVVLAAVVVAAAGCGGSPAHSRLDNRHWIEIAARDGFVRLHAGRLFPPLPRSAPCRIPRRGGTSGGVVPGTCTTSIRLAGSDRATVTFTETWSARNFRGPGAGTGRRLSHTWQVKLDYRLLGDKVVDTIDSGDVPPQRIRD